MTKTHLIWTFIFCVSINNAISQPRLGQTLEDIQTFATTHKWTKQIHLEKEGDHQYSLTYSHSGMNILYVFNEVKGIKKCITIITKYISKSDYLKAKHDLNISSTDKEIEIPNAAPSLKTYGTTIGGVDFFFGYDDENSTTIRGFGRHGM